jgi:hypothetical protein
VTSSWLQTWRKKLSLSSRKPFARSRRTGLKPALELLEQRTVPTVAFDPAFGPETVVYANPNDLGGDPGTPVIPGALLTNPTALRSPHLYMIFSGKGWVDGAGKPVPAVNNFVTDALTIVNSNYFSGLQQYGSDGKVIFNATDFVVDGTPIATDPSGNPSDTAEVSRILNRSPSPFPYPGGGTVLKSPIYMVVRDVDNSGGSNHSDGSFVPSQGPQAGQSLPFNWIDISKAQIEGGFTDLFGHELAERLSDGTGTGIKINAPPVPVPNSQTPYGQVGDNEPDNGRYQYRLAGPGNPVVQAYWSRNTVTENGTGAFIVPDGTKHLYELSTSPYWSGVGTSTFSWNNRQCDLTIDPNPGDTVTVDAPATNNVTITWNGQKEVFNTVNLVNIFISENQGLGAETINITRLAKSMTVYYLGNGTTGANEITLGAGNALSAIQGQVRVDDFHRPQVILDDTSNFGLGEAWTLKRNDVNKSRYEVDWKQGTNGGSLVYASQGATDPGILTIEAGGFSPNTFNVQDTPPKMSVRLIGSANSASHFTVNSAGGPLTMTAQLGAGSAAQDTFDIQRLSAGAFVTDASSSGAAITAAVGGNLTETLGGKLSVFGNGSTSLTINDQGSFGFDPTTGFSSFLSFVTLQANSYTHQLLGVPDFAEIDYQGLNQLRVNTGLSFPTVVTVSGTSAGTTTTVHAGGATLSTTVGGGDLSAIAGDLALNEVPKATQGVTLDDSKDAANQTGAQAVQLKQTSSPLGTHEITRPNGHGIFYDASVPTVLLKGGTGTVDYSVDSIPAKTTVTIQGGSGTGTVKVSPSAMNLKTLGGNLVVHGGKGPMDVVLFGQGNTVPDTFTFNVSQVLQHDPFTLNFTGVRTLTLNGGPSETYDVEGIAPGTTLVLKVGAGPNHFHIAPGLQGSLVLNGPVTYDDRADTANVTYNVTPTTFKKNGVTLFSYAGATSLSVLGGSGSDTFNVEGTAAATPVTITTGAGSNAVNVAPTSQDLTQILGDLTIHGHGQTRAVLNDQQDIIPILLGVDLPEPYLLTDSAVQFDFAGTGTIHYTGLSGLTLNADRLTDDVYDIESTAAGTPVTINTGPNANEVDVTPINKSLKNLKGNLVIQPSLKGQNSVTLDDSADTANTICTITAATVQASGAAPVTYAGATSLTVKGGSAADTFKVQGTAAATPVTLNTGAGSNTITVAGLSHSLDAIQGPVTVSAGAGPAALVVDDQATAGARTWTLTPGNLTATAAGTNGPGAHLKFAHLASLTVNGGSGGNTFDVQGTDAGTAFALNTGAGNDTVNVGDSRNTLEEFLGNLTVKGQAGSDTLNIHDQGELDPATQGKNFGFHTENDTWWPAGNGVPARVDFLHVPAGVLAQPGAGQFVSTSLYWQNLQQMVFTDPVGGSTAVHDFQPNALAGTHLTLHGGVLNDTLFSGANAGQQQTFTVTGPNAGTVGNISYTGVYYLLSFGSGQAKFKFLPGGSEGVVNGDGSPAVLDLSALTTPTTVQLPYFSGNTYNWGSVPGVVQALASPTSVVGAGGDTLVGGNAANTWSVTGQNAGQVGGVTFTGFPNLTGGSQADTFAFVNGGKVTGVVNGGGGVNTLDYSGYTGNILVDLPLGAASLVGGGVRNLQNVVGSKANSILIGNGAGNTLTGGTGRNLLIAGHGPGKLLGGPGDDILVGGSTNYDTDLTALNALMAEWGRTDLTYAQRVNHLLHGGGLNGATLLTGATFHGNGGGNVLTGAAGLDLFYGSKALDQNDWNAAQGEVFIEGQAHQNTGIDARGLNAPTLRLDNVVISTRTLSTFSLGVGSHTLTTTEGLGNSLAFYVAADGTVDYDPSLNGLLSGRGTTTLVVHGVTVTIDARALSYHSLVVDNTIVSPTAQAFTFTGLPGRAILSDPSGSTQSVPFTLGADGTVSYDPSLEGLLTGKGTKALTVHGIAVTIDARALSYKAVAADNTVVAPTAQPFSFTGLPGSLTLADPSGSTQHVTFTLAADGTVDYAPSLNSILTGKGTKALTVHGVAVTIDAHALSYKGIVADNTVVAPTAQPFAFTGLPGSLTLADPSGSTQSVTFTLGADGTVNYAPSLNNILSGRGTSTLTVQGVKVTIDATALSGLSLVVDGVTEQTKAPFTFTGLPGSLTLVGPQTGASITITINPDGTINYDPSLDSYLSGRGTSTLVVRGFPR